MREDRGGALHQGRLRLLSHAFAPPRVAAEGGRGAAQSGAGSRPTATGGGPLETAGRDSDSEPRPAEWTGRRRR